jgi:hypothetical protein
MNCTHVHEGNGRKEESLHMPQLYGATFVVSFFLDSGRQRFRSRVKDIGTGFLGLAFEFGRHARRIPLWIQIGRRKFWLLWGAVFGRLTAAPSITKLSGLREGLLQFHRPLEAHRNSNHRRRQTELDRIRMIRIVLMEPNHITRGLRPILIRISVPGTLLPGALSGLR